MEESSGSAAAGVFALLALVVWLAIIITIVAGFWKIFTKAGQPGWMALIPILNVFVLIRIAGKPAWWIILMLLPIVNIVVGIITVVGLAEKFGRSILFALGLIVLPFVFYPILGFGDSKYQDAPPQIF